ncbi:MAG TPA: DUF2117 domain-containing protein [Methanomicrobia archaeon]|nr:DUF2117 domain-containing protein [Methanomicrobia archaeon]
MTRLGLLVHGPEAVDEGEVERAFVTLQGHGFELEAALGGISGKTAVIDAGLQHMIDITKDMRPSEVLGDFLSHGIDFVILVNHAKTDESGLRLGEGILGNFVRTGGRPEELSFVQLEYCNRRCIRWLLKPGDDALYGELRELFSEFTELVPPKRESRCRRSAGLVYREIRGVEPGEKIVLNGVIIGTVSRDCRDSCVTLIAKEGRVVGLEGGVLIEHNLAKLPPVDLEDELIKSAFVIRRTAPKQVECAGTFGTGKRKKKACFLCTVEKLFPKLEDADATVEIVVTVGDDTTSIAGDILKRFGVRLIGLTDGDADGLITGIERGDLEEYTKFLPEGSMIIRLQSETDDVIGEQVKSAIFNGRDELELQGDVDQQFEVMKRRILELAGDKLVGVLSSESRDAE